jgi:hypothetical protein
MRFNVNVDQATASRDAVAQFLIPAALAACLLTGDSFTKITRPII